ncbi:ATP-binding protein [Variovorax sp. J22R133]|uniref:sensor histidine kinase n=1 Tax=Variovorax brevis TaxID=3053503 RepID=UPI002577E86C|nr:ATP-binding protein [Variovorax sp. J22R133]MDM0113008.1 ATP-binding protein [Variovorax sp. J22R133]
MSDKSILRGWFERATQPSLVQRSVVSILVGFLLIWAVLLAYLLFEVKSINVREGGLQKFAQALEASLADVHTDAEGAAFTAATATWVNIRRREINRLPGVIEFELLDADGRRIYATAALQDSGPLPKPDNPAQAIQVNAAPYRLVEAVTPRWTLRIAEPTRTDQAFLAYNARFLLPYLLLALPIVLLAIWLPIRRGLRPLQTLASRIAARDANDLSPVGVEARYRELKPLVGALDDLLQRLRLKVERERAFVQDAAHEIRTPLAVINAQAHVLAHAANEAERTQAEAQLNLAIARTSHMAQQLLELAALDEASPPTTRTTDVAGWLRDALAHPAQEAMDKGMELSLDAADSLTRSIDITAMTSIVHNLVDNAVRYGSRGNTVAVALHEQGHDLVLSVQDDGAGIAPSQHARVFERFYRGTDHEASGSGLGLAIVRQAALRMGGHVDIVEGLNGRGVGFRVRIPPAR